MIRYLKPLAIVLLLVSLAGCWPPKETFSFIDRNCFVADWTNDHSCLSCRRCANNQPPDARPPGPPILAPGIASAVGDPEELSDVDATPEL
jgi:hypothetical protein